MMSRQLFAKQVPDDRLWRIKPLERRRLAVSDPFRRIEPERLPFCDLQDVKDRAIAAVKIDGQSGP